MFDTNIRHWPLVSLRKRSLESQSIGWIALVVMILASSTYNSFGKQLSGALSPLSILVLSEFLTAFFVLLSFGVFPTVRRLFAMKRKYVLPLIALGLCNGLLAPLLFFSGLQYTTAINAELFGRMEMVFLMVLAIAILRQEHWTRAHIIASSVIIFGIAFVALRGFSEDFSTRPGDPLILLSTFAYACGGIIFKKYLHKLDSELVIVSRASVAVGAFFLVSPFIEHPLREELLVFPAALVPALLGFGFVSRFLNLFSFYEAIERIPVSAVSLFSTINIVCGIAFAHFYLGEPILWYHLVGGGLILLGVLLLEILGVHQNESELEQHMKQHHRHHL
ncbi:DMT family transporter [Candidatus Peregrinibacteria bacterium]|nr:DMT family transporter [Candidatus Peregrinibacteria bacterium]